MYLMSAILFAWERNEQVVNSDAIIYNYLLFIILLYKYAYI